MRVLSIAIALVAFSLFTAPSMALEAADAQSQASDANAGSSDTTAETADAAVEETPPGIMDTPLDGSSVESFKTGLAGVDEAANEKQYRTLMSALDYLLFYDLSAQRNRAKLYSNLDGQTPNQIIEQVRQRRRNK